MTRKKSNVKALALAVTCAILAGGYSGLNPVYAETPVKITPSGTISGDTTSGYTFTGTEITISGSTIAGALDGINISKAYVEGTRTLKALNDDVATNSAATQTNATSITNNTNKINNVDSKYEAITNNIKTDMSTQVSTINTKIDTKLDTSTFGAYTASNDTAVNELKNKTQNIRVDTDTMVISSDATYIDGITHAGGVRLADNGVRAEELVLEEGSAQATLTREGLAALNSMVYDANDKINNDTDGKPIIQAGNGSVVGGVTLDSGNITGVQNATVGGTLKVDNIKSLDGHNEITVADMATTKYNTDKISYDANDGTTIAGDVMVNKGAPNQVKINSEGIVVGLNSTVVGSDGVYAGGHNYNDAKAAIDGVNGKIKGADGKFGVDDQGNVTTTGNIQGQDITVNGKLNAKGDAVVGGDLSVTGKADFTKEATFSGGIKTDGIYEATADKGVTVDGVLLKDKGISAAGGAFTVDGASGDTNVGGKLDVTGDTTLKGKLDVTGDTNLKGKLDVTGNATVGGTFGVTGAATLGSTLEVTGKATLKDELQVDKKATFGSAAGSQTVINGGDITADGQLNAKSARIGGVNGVGISDSGVITGVTKLTTKALEVTDDLVVSGDITGAALKGTSLAITGNGTITGDLGVTGAITGATINGATITTNSFNGATIGATTFNGVTLTTDGDVSGRNMTASGTVKGNEITDGAGASMKAGTVTGTKITDGTGFTATGGNVTAKDINATTATIAGVGFASNNVSSINNLTATGTIQGATLKVNDSNLLGNDGLKATKAVIDNLTIDGASITSNNADGSVGVAGITVDKTGAITGVKAIDGVAVAGNTTSGLTIGSGATAVTIGGNSLALSSTNFSVDNDGDVTGQSFTAGTSHLNNGELKLNDKNIWTTAEGIKAEKAVIGVNTLNGTGISTTGTLDVEGVAKFGKNDADQTKITQGKAEFTQGGKTTTIKGGEIEADKLTVNDIVLKNSMTNDATGSTITIKGSDGSMSVAGGKFAVDKDGQLTNKITGIASGFGYETKLETSKSGIKANYTNAINGNQNIIDMGASGISIGVAGTTPSVGAGFKAELDAATMGYGTANSIVVNKDTIKSALGTDVTRVMTNNTTEQSIVDKVGTARRSLKADEIVDEVAGTTITTNNTGTTFSNGTNNTLINGSAITSTNGTATGVLNGSNLTLTNGANSTVMTAGGATFNGAAGEKGGKTTTIAGGTITTDTLNVERINLGGEVIDKGAAGVEANSKLYMDAQGNFRAAGGNFKVNGADGAMTNTVGNTTLKTDANGAGMSYDNTAATGGVNSNISVADGKAEMAVGANAAVTATDGKVEIKGGTQNLTTTDAGTVFENSAHNTPFVAGGAANTVINGNEITTGKLTTDQLVITGSGAAGGAGSIAFGGDGSITSNIKDAATGKEATFKTNADGTFTEAKDGANVTTNTVNAQGNTNVVTDGTNTSTATQTATSIGGVVTNGTVTMKQELTADGLKLEQTGYDEVNIAKGDVTVKNNRNTANPNQEVHLSDLGSLNNLDSELTARDEYKDNKTAVGAINAEAGIRREEVARLDNRIDDVNNRVDKVGAMAAAIASLKSIGYDPQAPSEFSIGLGQYKGETGVAMGFFHYPNKNFMINVSLSTAGGETMGGIGATWRFGHKSPQKLLEEQREAQAKKELAAAEKYQAAAKLAKEAQERAEYAAKLARQAQVSADNAKAAADATQAKHFQ